MITRREWLLGSAAAAALPFSLQLANARESFDASAALPHKDAFFPFEGTYMNSASQHPMSRAARKAADEYLEYKKFSAPGSYSFA